MAPAFARLRANARARRISPSLAPLGASTQYVVSPPDVASVGAHILLLLDAADVGCERISISTRTAA